jgi:hypothetical protein
MEPEFSSPSTIFNYDNYVGNIQVYCEGFKYNLAYYNSHSPNISVEIHGTNANAYTLSSSIIPITVVKKPNVAPTVAITLTNIQKVTTTV